MRIGVVSDTHNNLRNVGRIVEQFNAANVEHVVHTGDITQPKTLAAFSDLVAPMTGVFGNNDIGELDRLAPAARRHGYEFVMPPLRLTWAGRQIVVVHDPLELEPLDLRAFDLVLHGHTHRRTIEAEAGRLRFNPGECAGMMAGYNAVGVVDLTTLEPEILTF